MVSQSNPPGGYHGGRGGGYLNETISIDTSAIRLKKYQGKSLDPNLFDGVANEAAKIIGQNDRGNKSSQIRQFYDELVMWEEKVRQSPEKFEDYLPFIRMLNAKAAYAEGRRHVDGNFTTMISHCLAQVDDVESLHNFKLFFEAFLGFFKLVNPKG